MLISWGGDIGGGTLNSHDSRGCPYVTIPFIFGGSYCWWFRNPAITSWGRLVVYPKVLYIPDGCWGFLPSIVGTQTTNYPNKQLTNNADCCGILGNFCGKNQRWNVQRNQMIVSTSHSSCQKNLEKTTNVSKKYQDCFIKEKCLQIFSSSLFLRRNLIIL